MEGSKLLNFLPETDASGLMIKPDQFMLQLGIVGIEIEPGAQ